MTASSPVVPALGVRSRKLAGKFLRSERMMIAVELTIGVSC